MTLSAIRRRDSSSPWAALALIVAAQFMVILDVAIVNVALPSIEVDLGFSQSSLEWVVTAYAIVFGGFLLLGGRLADLVGRRRMFMAGIGLFTARLGALRALVVCGLARRIPRAPGARRSAARARGPVAPDDDLRRGT